MSSVKHFFSRLRTRATDARAALADRGASLVEYALLIALIAVVCIGAVTFIGTTASSKYSVYDNCVSWAGSGGTIPIPCRGPN